eukprot:GHVS01056012.1.p1 GENE.GHVS01056012.1~~GHVS01056012.1.p1  ORF type:complete len:572 (+),score=33.54 GHVS01056012.1:293-2008(+)
MEPSCISTFDQQAADRWLSPSAQILRIRDFVYDVSEFSRKHPGGSVISYFFRQDATEAFDAFHTRSNKAVKILNSLPRIPLDLFLRLRKEKEESSPGLVAGTAYQSPSPPPAGAPPLAIAHKPTAGDYDTHIDFVGAKKSARTQKLLTEFRSFRSELHAEGSFDPDYAHVIWRVLEVALLFVVHYYLLYLAGSGGSLWPLGEWGRFGDRPNGAENTRKIEGVLWSWSYLMTGLVVGGIAGGRAGWVQHEGGHGSLTGNLTVDKLIQQVNISFGLICFNRKWNNMHNKHHAVPQKEELDPDLDTLPFLATYEQVLFRGRRRHMVKHMAGWLKYQHYSFLLLTAVLNVFFWHFYLHPREYLIRRFSLPTFALVLSRYVVHLSVTVPLFGWTGGFFTLMATMFVSGLYLFGNFSLNHTYMPTVEKHIHKNWLDQQLDHTINIKPHPIVNWWMGYLNCQIEHHLFPNMPQCKQPSIVDRTRAFCESNGIEYNMVGYFEALRLMLGNLRIIANAVDRYKPFYEKVVPVKHLRESAASASSSPINIITLSAAGGDDKHISMVDQHRPLKSVSMRAGA